jgi:hypothetical protein
MTEAFRETPLSESTLGNQLDKLLSARWLPGGWVQRVWNPTELPLRLEQCVQSLSPEATWRAYTDGVRLWFAIAATADAKPYGTGSVALEVHFFEDNGELCAGGIWSCDADGVWRLEKVMDISEETRCLWDLRLSRHHWGAA